MWGLFAHPAPLSVPLVVRQFFASDVTKMSAHLREGRAGGSYRFPPASNVIGAQERHEHQRIHFHSNSGKRHNWLDESSIHRLPDPLPER